MTRPRSASIDLSLVRPLAASAGASGHEAAGVGATVVATVVIVTPLPSLRGGLPGQTQGAIYFAIRLTALLVWVDLLSSDTVTLAPLAILAPGARS